VGVIRLLALMVLLAAVSGCATFSYPLPKCDGYAKRPLNRSMWDWDQGRAQNSRQSSISSDTSTATAFAEEAAVPLEEAVALAGFDEVGSHSSCRTG
jgi:type IV secretion system protein VirB7